MTQTPNLRSFEGSEVRLGDLVAAIVVRLGPPPEPGEAKPRGRDRRNRGPATDHPLVRAALAAFPSATVVAAIDLLDATDR